MAKKESESNNPPKREAAGRKMMPTEWAKEDKKDPHLFAWHDENKGQMSKQEFDELKKKICR